jgi:dTDP-4-dehydrorhamnose 3,5-epimerase
MVKRPRPHGKLLRCLSGTVFDVAAYLGRDLSTFERGIGRELDAVTAAALLVPPGFGHGMLELTSGRPVDIRIVSGEAR